MSHLNAVDERILALEQRLSQVEQLLIRTLNANLVPAQSELLSPSLSPPNPGAFPISILQPIPEWIPILHHSTNTPSCGKPAQYVVHRLRLEEEARLSKLRINTNDGRGWRQPDPKEIACCSSCGAFIDAHSSVDLDWSEAYGFPAGSPPISVTNEVRASQVLTSRAGAEQRSLLDQAKELLPGNWDMPPHG